MSSASFVVATPFRTAADSYARALDSRRLLRRYILGTRRGTPGIRSEVTRLNPAIGLVAYGAAKTLPVTTAESVRFALNPWYDGWVLQHLRPGDHLLTSYGYANRSLTWIGKHGGYRFLDAGNSHPEHFWSVVSEEHKIWKVNQTPIARHQHARALKSLEHTDYFFCPSNHVLNSFKERGFPAEKLIRIPYPTDLSRFAPKPVRPKDQPLRVINTGLLCLRKGTPYLLEAFRLVSREVKNAELWLTRIVFEDVNEILRSYSDLNINWAPALPHHQLAQRMQAADIFVLPSLEEGMARTSLEALASGLPIIVTPSTGSNDFVIHRQNGSIVPIRDPHAIANEILWWWDRVHDHEHLQLTIDRAALSVEAFDRACGEVLSKFGFESPAG
ncbi:MAG: glycosyltransferase family 4 protein [Verrucomicrobia bacterium]|nr:glycosyltransferase family 4 protein [Verrucomicrobiota bacterium]